MSGYVRGPLPRYWHSIDTMNAGTAVDIFVPTPVALNTANKAVYVPVTVDQRVIVKQLWYANSSTATGNYDIGLYDAAGTALLRKGSAAKTTTSAEIVWDCTDTTIGPGIYYLALVSSNATDTFLALSLAAPTAAALGIYSETSALPLPATATFALDQALTAVPIMGMFLDTRVT